jgi:Nucleolar protein,Nop52
VLETAEESKFARVLASTDHGTREKGLRALTKWLSCREEVADDDLLKIWKGLFYSFWHSDKAPAQVWVLLLPRYYYCIHEFVLTSGTMNDLLPGRA